MLLSTPSLGDGTGLGILYSPGGLIQMEGRLSGNRGTRKTILGCKTSQGMERGLSTPGFLGNTLRKRKRGRILFLSGNRKFSFLLPSPWGLEEGAYTSPLRLGPWEAPVSASPGTCSGHIQIGPFPPMDTGAQAGGRRLALGPLCGAPQPVSPSPPPPRPQRSTASPARRRTGASSGRSPSSWTGVSWPTSSPG